MSLLFRWQGGTLDYGTAAPPGLTGYGDVGCATGGNNGVAAFLDTTTHQMANRTVVALRAVHAVGMPDPQWRIPPNVHPSQGPALVTGPFSARLYWRRAANHATRMPIIRFREGSTLKLQVGSNQDNRFILPGLTGQAAAATPHTAMWRIELQVDPQRNPSVVMRVYLEDNTTPVVNLTANPADVAWDNFLIGLFNGYHPVQASWADIEVHDDYDLGGQFTSNPEPPAAASTTAVGAPASNPVVEPRFHYDEGTGRTVVTKGEPSYTSHLDVIYVDDPSHAGRALDLYVPTGTPPEGGWPVILWAHGGFWTAGGRKDLPSNWRDDLLAAGWAVATVSYCRSTLTVLAYPEYGSGGDGGRWPSFPLDFKRAAAFLRDNAATWGINPERMVASGFSAGGHIALAAACSAGLTADAAGNPMTLAGAAAAGHRWADGYTGPDPEFAGVLVTAAPVDVDLATAWDPTHPSAGSVMHIAIRAFRGLSQTGGTAPSVPEANVADLIARNAGRVPPIAFVGSLSDYLVHWEHEQALAAACATHGVDYSLLATPNAHDPAQRIYDIDQQLAWLDGLGGEGPPPPGPRVLWVEDGVELVECALSIFDGATEVPLTLEVAGGE